MQDYQVEELLSKSVQSHGMLTHTKPTYIKRLARQHGIVYAPGYLGVP